MFACRAVLWYGNRMAKRALVRRAGGSPVVVVSAPRAPARRSRARALVARAGRGARRVGRVAHKALPTTSVAVGGLVVGYLDGSGYLDKLPAIQGSRAITLGLVGYAATRFFKNHNVRAAGLAALGAAAVELGRTQSKRGASGWGTDEGWGSAGDDGWAAGDGGDGGYGY